jgi:replicative DNA helicase
MIETEPIELSIIGAMLLPEVSSQAMAGSAGTLFQSSSGKLLYSAVMSVYKSGNPITADTLSTAMQIEHGVSHSDASVWVQRAIQTAATPSSLPFMMRSLATAKVRSIGDKLADSLKNGIGSMRSDELIALLAKTQRDVAAIGSEGANDYRGEMDRLSNQGKVKYFVPGIGALDKVLQFDEGTVSYIGGRSAGGKTAMLLNMAFNMAEAGHNVGLIEIEMRRGPVASRLAGRIANLNTRRVMKGILTDSEREHLRWMMSQHDKTMSRIRGIEPSAFHVDMLRPTMEQWRDQWGCEVVLLDYVQILSTNERDDTASVKAASRGVTAAAKETGIPIIALSQLRKTSESVTQQDFRGSSQLENDCDTMVVLEPESDEPESYDTEWRRVKCKILKNRNGPKTTDILNYHLPTQVITHSGEYEKVMK